jgi:hypothetical protein
MKVKYNDFSATVPDDVNPDTVLNTLKGSFTELSNGAYTFATENGEKVMQIYLKTGSKA